MPHELRNRAGCAFARALRNAFTNYKNTRNSWEVGHNKRYVDLSSKCHPIVQVSDNRNEENNKLHYFDDRDNDDSHIPRVEEDERRVYNGDCGCKNTS